MREIDFKIRYTQFYGGTMLKLIWNENWVNAAYDLWGLLVWLEWRALDDHLNATLRGRRNTLDKL